MLRALHEVEHADHRAEPRCRAPAVRLHDWHSMPIGDQASDKTSSHTSGKRKIQAPPKEDIQPFAFVLFWGQGFDERSVCEPKKETRKECMPASNRVERSPADRGADRLSALPTRPTERRARLLPSATSETRQLGCSFRAFTIRRGGVIIFHASEYLPTKYLPFAILLLGKIS